MDGRREEERAPEWPVYHWDRVEYSDGHGVIARSGTSVNPNYPGETDDAKEVKPVKEEVDAKGKLKKDKEAMMKRIIQDGEEAATKTFTLDSGLKVVLPSKKDKQNGGRRTRGKKRGRSKRKSTRRKRTRKRRKKRRKSRRRRR